MFPRRSRLIATLALVVAAGAAVAVPAVTGTRPEAGDQTPHRSATSSSAPTPTPTSGTARSASPKPTRRPEAGHVAVRPRTQRHVLPRGESGAGAIAALGTRLPQVAARNGLSAPKLRTILRTDPTAHLSERGDLFYVERAADTALAAGTGGTAPGSAPTYSPLYPIAQTFLLHSRPGATRTIFLDFDGGTVSGTAWNDTTQQQSLPDGVHVGLDLDGSPTSLSTNEDGFIQAVWRQVSEIYAPFDVDVTTTDPGLAGVTRSSTTDPTYGTHVMITSDPAAQQALCTNCLGLAWLDTFDQVDRTGYYAPAWVFDDDPTMDPMVVAEAAAHEAGHTLGLNHDGTATAAYYDGTTGWGPIMGSSGYRAVNQFSKGEYAGANNTEDDFAVIQAHGLPLRADDHPSSVSTAQQLAPASSYAESGVIESRTDTDVFAVNLPCATTLTAAVAGIGAQTTLDASLTVLDSQGRTVATSSPVSSYRSTPPVSTGMNAQVSVPSATGTYYLVVDGVGNGSPSSGGWSDYGSLGQYTLTASGCPASATPVPSVTPTPTAAPVPTPSPTPTATPKKRPTPPRIGSPLSGVKGGTVTAAARWSPPLSTDGLPVLGYHVAALRLDASGRVSRTQRSLTTTASRRTLAMVLPAGRYRFRVSTWTKAGNSTWSSNSTVVTAR